MAGIRRPEADRILVTMISGPSWHDYPASSLQARLHSALT